MTIAPLAQLRSQAAPAADGIAAASAEPGAMAPVVLCGDLNDDPDSPCVAAVLSDPGLPLLSALADYQPSAHPSAEAGAFTTWKFRVYDDGSVCEKRAVIDYVFHSPALRPVARWAQPTKEEIGPQALPSETYPSDHLAVCVEFEWDGANAA